MLKGTIKFQHLHKSTVLFEVDRDIFIQKLIELKGSADIREECTADELAFGECKKPEILRCKSPDPST